MCLFIYMHEVMATNQGVVVLQTGQFTSGIWIQK